MQYIQAFKQSNGSHAFGPSWRPAAGPDFLARFQAAAEEAAGGPVALFVVPAAQAPVSGPEQAAAARRLTATIEDGQVTAVTAAPPKEVWLHVAITGGDGDDPPGILNDGTDALSITATLRATVDPASPVIPVSGTWRVTVRDDTGAIYDVVKVQMNAGVVSASYTTTSRPAVCELREQDFTPVPDPAGGEPYTVRLAGQAAWKVYREL